MARSAQEVFEDHLRLRSSGDLDRDLDRNYAEDVTLLCEEGVLRGRSAVRESARRLGLQLPQATFEFPARVVGDSYAFLIWRAHSAEFEVEHGADSFAIRDGRIVMQSIFYRLSRGSVPSHR